MPESKHTEYADDPFSITEFETYYETLEMQSGPDSAPTPYDTDTLTDVACTIYDSEGTALSTFGTNTNVATVGMITLTKGTDVDSAPSTMLLDMKAVSLAGKEGEYTQEIGLFITSPATRETWVRRKFVIEKSGLLR